MELALAQLQIEGGAPATNTERALSALEKAAQGGADLVALPEIFNVGYFSFESYASEAEPLDGPTITRLQEAAGDHGIAVLAGTVVEDLAASAARGFETPAQEGYANTAVFVDETGQRRGVYRKRHLFGYGSQEQELLEPGESLCTVEYAGFTVGVTTCYDLRFPTLYRHLVDEGATLVLVPSAWPYPRVEHWRTLPQARAIENLLYVATINGVGEFDGSTLLGRSTVYDPWGTTVAGAGDEPAVLTASLDPDRVSAVREEFPALADRRL
jgi:predicted amidohydrolase